MITQLSETDVAVLRQMAADFRARNPGTFSQRTVRQPRMVEGKTLRLEKLTPILPTATPARLQFGGVTGQRRRQQQLKRLTRI